ncbi:hypothetical protein Q673_03495 [Marinobacter sp. EN3]|uniref:hypothetical protein n=1 Tax=Marinobacter sp. EN3 TaxID=1397533 RepID=UPI0003B80E1E|nr:hypothetical protein [Marinobacter sp. EN3]ERS12689.1 hypothetical protein Q673_03495 [Marinobacter sp. EN3]
MFKKTLISLAVASSLGLTGCFDSGSTGKNANPDYKITDTTLADTRPIFNPNPLSDDFEVNFSKDISVPASFDLHLLLKASLGPNYDFTDVRGFGLAGHSVNSHIDIEFNGSLEKGSIEAGQSVFLVPLNTTPLAESLNKLELTSNPAFIDLSSEAGPFDLAKYESQRIRATAISLNNEENNVLRITPLEPLEPQTKYLVIVTSNVKDSAGKSTGPSQTYKGFTEQALGNPALKSVVDVVQASDTLGELWLTKAGIDADITLAYTVTTTNTETVFNSIASPATYLETLGQQIVVYSALQKARELIQAEIAAGDREASDFTATNIFARVQAALAKTGEAAAADPIVQAVGPYIQNPALIADNIVPATVPALPFPKPRTARFYNHQDAEDLPFIPADANNPLNQAASVVKVAEGAIELPYYLDIPNSAVEESVKLTIGGKWSGSTTLEDTINEQIDTLRNSSPGLANLPSFAFPRDADGKTFNVNQYMPFPEQKGSVAVPVTVFYPKTGCATGSGITDVVIFQHGITTDRSVAALPAINMAAQTLEAGKCVATVAIDQPLHGLAGGPLPGALPGLSPISAFGDISADFSEGAVISERHFMATRDNDADGFAATFADTLADVESGSLFLNLVSPETARDNIRQAVLDLLNLSATVNFAKELNPLAFNFAEVGTVELSAAKFHFVGHSLGGISGLPFAALSKDPVVRGSYAALGSQAAFADLDSIALMNTGGQLTRIVENSGAFSQVALPALDAAGFSQGTSQFENFMYIFQSVVDDIDPVNYAKRLGEDLGASNLLISSVVPDLTVPNEANVNPLRQATSSPLTGTEPLMALLNLGANGGDLVDSSIVDSTLGAPAGLVSTFFDGTNPCTDANHGTFVAPAVPADQDDPDPICPNGSNTSDAFAEMIAQVIGNITGAGIPGGDRLSPSPTIERVLDQDKQ